MNKLEILDSLPTFVMANALADQPEVASDLPKWSGADQPPAIGDVVDVRINRCGPAKVLGYFVQEGWLGVKVQLQSPPDWFVRRNGGNVPCHAFGAEIRAPAVTE